MKLKILARTWVRFEIECEPNTEAIYTEVEKYFNSLPNLAGDQYIPYLDNADCITDQNDNAVEIKQTPDVELEFDIHTKALPEKSDYFLFGEDACNIYSEDGLDALIESIENDNTTYSLFEYTGDLSEFLSEFDGWHEYAYISKDEYDKLLEV